ncbi:hypothetical protein HCJ93_21910 [Streptomyces sp. SBST2-5]|uniref:Uncharacterized protein n=1 Tax=Streptomyces composti TaxID=2720025 RepID=A0ABX1ADA5_9ACTN|nr:hypothetical protein [Streptomyces composti]NJP52644.1 hypothetical protein [Streptomyces composti]
MIKPEAIPQFTGDLSQLDQHTDALMTEADGIRQAGGEAHRQFQGLAAFYKAPEAEQLFASTKPASDAADAFADKVDKVADALRTYATEVAPIIKKLKQLQVDAATFVAGLKSENGEFDENWNKDEAKVEEHQALLHEVNAAQAEFTAAEIACANKISALVGGTQYRMITGDRQIKWFHEKFYGYSAEVLDQAEELPWGTPVTERHDWWDPEDLGYYAKSFVWDGFIVDGVWGTVEGIGTLVGFDGSHQAKQAWEGIFRALIGTEVYLMEAGGQKPSGVLGTKYAQESKLYAKEFGKSLVAWDMWEENPARATGTVVFNLLTLGVGPLKAASASRAGTAARAAAAAAKVGEVIDPIGAAFKVTGAAVPRIAQVTQSLRGMNTIPEVRTPTSVLQFTDDTGRSVLVIENGEFVVMKDGKVVTDAPVRERSVTLQEEPLGRTPVRDEELVPVGAASRTTEATARAGVDGGPSGEGDSTAAGGSRSERPGHAAAAAPVGEGAARASASQSGGGGGGEAAGVGGRGGTGSHGSGAAGDGAIAAGGDDGGRVGAGLPASRQDIKRPSFMREGPNPYGPPGSLTREQIEAIQVYRANHEPGYFEKYYNKKGWRKRLEVRDESGFTPPQLAQITPDGPWLLAKDTPAAPEPHFLDDDYVSVGADTVSSAGRRQLLEDATRERHFAVQWDNIVKELKGRTERAHEVHGTPETAAEWGEARGTFKESHTAMRDASEEFGEQIARHHYMAERYPDFEEQPLLGPKNGNDQFDQVWKHADGRIVVIEAKGGVRTDLGSRKLPDGRAVSQGSREYFQDILEYMKMRGEVKLVRDIEKALRQGKLEYVVVKGQINSGTYTGYAYRRFDISKGTLS